MYVYMLQRESDSMCVTPMKQIKENFKTLRKKIKEHIRRGKRSPMFINR